MRRGHAGAYVLFGLLVVLVVYPALDAFLSRFGRDEALPPYSTYRTGPMGTSALYGALDRIPDIAVERNRQPFELFQPPADATMIMASARPGPDPLALIERIESFMAEGGRLVVAHFPIRDRDALSSFEGVEGKDEVEGESEDTAKEEAADTQEADSERASDAEGEAEGEGESEGEGELEGEAAVDAALEEILVDVVAYQRPEDREPLEEDSSPFYSDPFGDYYIDIADRWGFAYDVDDMAMPFRTALRVYEAPGYADLPEWLAWGSGMYFDARDESWTVLYERDGKPVVIERSWESGSMVLASDAYFLSNEAMRDAREPGLIAWLLGDHARVVFDEAHLGLADPPSTFDLIVRLRFGGLYAGLVIAGLLVGWGSMASFVPQIDRRAALRSVRPAHTSLSGLRSLLERNVPRKRLMRVCVDEWTKAVPLLGARAAAALEAVEETARRTQADVPAANWYREIAATWKARR